MTNRYFADKKDMYLNIMEEDVLVGLIDKFIENGIEPLIPKQQALIL